MTKKEFKIEVKSGTDSWIETAIAEGVKTALNMIKTAHDNRGNKVKLKIVG